jgi:histidyl-tRNA synthetase
LLEAIIEEAGASLDKFKTICSSIDKLDKEKWEDVAKELIEDKGISKE